MWQLFRDAWILGRWQQKQNIHEPMEIRENCEIKLSDSQRVVRFRPGENGNHFEISTWWQSLEQRFPEKISQKIIREKLTEKMLADLRRNKVMINNDTYIKYDMLGSWGEENKSKKWPFSLSSLHCYRTATRHTSTPSFAMPRDERLPKICFLLHQVQGIVSIFHHFSEAVGNDLAVFLSMSSENSTKLQFQS